MGRCFSIHPTKGSTWALPSFFAFASISHFATSGPQQMAPNDDIHCLICYSLTPLSCEIHEYLQKKRVMRDELCDITFTHSSPWWWASSNGNDLQLVLRDAHCSGGHTMRPHILPPLYFSSVRIATWMPQRSSTSKRAADTAHFRSLETNLGASGSEMPHD